MGLLVALARLWSAPPTFSHPGVISPRGTPPRRVTAPQRLLTANLPEHWPCVPPECLLKSSEPFRDGGVTVPELRMGAQRGSATCPGSHSHEMAEAARLLCPGHRREGPAAANGCLIGSPHCGAQTVVPPTDHRRLLSVAPFSALGPRGWDLGFLPGLTVRKASGVSRSLSAVGREAGGIPGTGGACRRPVVNAQRAGPLRHRRPRSWLAAGTREGGGGLPPARAGEGVGTVRAAAAPRVSPPVLRRTAPAPPRPSFSEAHAMPGSGERDAEILGRVDTSVGHTPLPSPPPFRTEVACKQVGRSGFVAALAAPGQSPPSLWAPRARTLPEPLSATASLVLAFRRGSGGGKKGQTTGRPGVPGTCPPPDPSGACHQLSDAAGDIVHYSFREPGRR